MKLAEDWRSASSAWLQIAMVVAAVAMLAQGVVLATKRPEAPGISPWDPALVAQVQR